MTQTGILYIVATPLGNLGDLPPRAGKTLAEADLVAAEDTRRARKLLSHLHLSKPIIRADAYRESDAGNRILSRLQTGQSVALVSDAGVPGISDPGARIVDAVLRAGYPVVPIGGPSAVTLALSASGFGATPFLFLGFFARKGAARNRQIKLLHRAPHAVVFFESPHRIGKTLKELADHSPERWAVVAREMSKIYEEFVRAPLMDLATRYASATVKGEITVVVAPKRFENVLAKRKGGGTMDEE